MNKTRKMFQTEIKFDEDLNDFKNIKPVKNIFRARSVKRREVRIILRNGKFIKSREVKCKHPKKIFAKGGLIHKNKKIFY